MQNGTKPSALRRGGVFLAGLLLVAVVVAVLQHAGGATLFSGGKDAPRLPREPLVIETQGGESHRFRVEVALSEEDMREGLMQREMLPKDAGMLFLLGDPPRVVSFWMKNTLIPLDILFIDRENRIAHIHENAKPQDLTPISSQVPVVMALEIPGGRAADLGLRAGDSIVFPADEE